LAPKKVFQTPGRQVLNSIILLWLPTKRFVIFPKSKTETNMDNIAFVWYLLSLNEWAVVLIFMTVDILLWHVITTSYVQTRREDNTSFICSTNLSHCRTTTRFIYDFRGRHAHMCCRCITNVKNNKHVFRKPILRVLALILEWIHQLYYSLMVRIHYLCLYFVFIWYFNFCTSYEYVKYYI